MVGGGFAANCHFFLLYIAASGERGGVASEVEMTRQRPQVFNMTHTHRMRDTRCRGGWVRECDGRLTA